MTWGKLTDLTPILILLALAPPCVLAVSSGSRRAALLVIGLYALAFLFLTLLDLHGVVLSIVFLLPLITLEVGFADANHTLSADKVALAIAAGGWWLRRGIRVFGVAIREFAPVRWLAAFCLVVAIGAGVRGFAFGQLWALAEQLVMLSVLLMGLDAFGTERMRTLGIRYFMWGSALVSALSVLQFAGFALAGWTVPLFFKSGTSLDTFDPFDTPSPIGHKNYLGGYVALALPLTVVALLTGQLERRWVIWGVLAAQIGTVLLVQSVGTLWALVTVLALALLAGRRRLSLPAKLSLLSAGGAAVLASGPFLSWANSVRYRLEFHRLGIRMFVDHPLLGLGAEGFRRQYGAYQQSGLFDPQQFPQLATTHSSFLEVLVSWGVPGIVCFAGALLWIFKRPGLVIRRRLAEGTAAPVLGLWLGLLAFVINAASENLFSFSKLEAVFWTLSALLMRLAAEESTRIRTGTR